MVKIVMENPALDEESDLARRFLSPQAPEAVLASGAVSQVLTGEELPAVREALNGVLVKDDLVDYIVAIVRATRENPSILVGGGPRATQALLLGSRALAAISGRDFVTPEDIKYLAVPVLGHRLVIRPEYEIEGVTCSEIVSTILEEVAVPR